MALNKNIDAKAIVKQNFVLAVMEAMKVNVFKSSYHKYEDMLDKAIEERIKSMPSDDIGRFAVAIVDGGEIGYSLETEQFFVIETDSSVLAREYGSFLTDVGDFSISL